jgi:hypothetical protein
MASRAPAFPLTVRLAVLVVPVFLVPVFLVAVAACALGAWLGAWWVPFVIGAAAAMLGRAGGRGGRGSQPAEGARRRSRARGAVLPAVAGALVGWAIPLWALALDGQPVGATARAIAGLAGLPPYAGVTVAVVLLLAALQVLVGAWLARAVLPRRQPVGEVTDSQVTDSQA